ncbi:MAG: pantetheine-phosphate adenylyltransferase [Deltaproteobacteria bacterium]|nr:pantetheine-phosphate adenylyltransferase [Deltaproteobacteria bacterium]
MARVGIYPGSFDPLTMGHVNIVQRSLRYFDVVVVAVLNHPEKRAMFTPEERAGLIADVFTDEKRVQVDHFGGLLVDYVRSRGADAVIRGLRAVQDFEYEFQMTMMNRRLAPDLDTVFMMTDEEHFYIASRTVKEVAKLGGTIDGLVPEQVKAAMFEKLGRSQ